MTSGIGATLPLQAAPSAIDGEVVDPEASLPFLALLAAAVAAPVSPPVAVEPPVILLDAQATAEEGQGGDVEGATAAAVVSATLVDHAPPSDESLAAAESARDGAIAASGDGEATASIEDDAEGEATGSRLRVLVADRAAPPAVDARAVPVAAPTSPRGEAGGHTSTRDEAHEERGKALGKVNRAEPGSHDVPREGSNAATPSWHAAMQALAAPSRSVTPETVVPSAPHAAQQPSNAKVAGEVGQPSSGLSTTAAGVLAAMHAAHLAQEGGEHTDAPNKGFANALLVTVASEANEPGTPAVAAEGGLAERAPVSDDALESVPLPTTQRVVVAPRTLDVRSEQDAAHEHRDEAPGQERRALTAAATDTTDAPVATARAPWMAADAPSIPRTTEGKVTAQAPHRSAEPATTPSVPTSQVTVELDAERTGAQRVRVAVRGDVVHATVVTDRGGADAMRPQLDELRHALEGQGFREAHVQLRVAGDGSPSLSHGAAPELRLRSDGPTRSSEGQGTEQHPRGRQRGQDHQPPSGGQPEFEEELQ